jgi:hypothetical protein
VFTGDVEKDFTTGADLKPRKGVIKINDATLTGGQTPVDSPDVGLPPGPRGRAACLAGTSRTCTSARL